MKGPGAVVGLALLTAILFAAMASYTSPLDPSIPALQFSFSEAAFRQVVEQWSAADLERFRRHFLIDYPFMLCYGLLGYRLSTRTALFARAPAPARRVLATLLPLAALADVVENLLHRMLVAGEASYADHVYFVAGAIATSKWMLILTFILASIVFAALAARASKTP